MERRSFRVTVDLIDESGGEPARLVDSHYELEERDDVVDSIEVPTAELAAGTYLIVIKAIDEESGLVLSEATEQFEL